MRWLLALVAAVLAIAWADGVPKCSTSSGEGRSARRRRYLTFPAGSSFQIVYTWSHFFDYVMVPFRIALVAEVTAAYPLPSSITQNFLFYEIPKVKYEKVEKPPMKEPQMPEHMFIQHDIHDHYPPLPSYYIHGNKEEKTRRKYSPAKRRNRDLRYTQDRKRLYKDLAELLTQHGVDGRACVHRARCEAHSAAKDPEDLVHSALQLLFRSSKGLDIPSEEKSRQCQLATEICPFSLLEPDIENFL